MFALSWLCYINLGCFIERRMKCQTMKYLKYINFHENKDIWFDNVKNITEQMGYATSMIDYKGYPDNYKWSIVDLTNALRIAITGRTNAPDIWEVSNVIGERCVIERIKSCLI